MGYIRHHAIVVTAYGHVVDELAAAHALAVELGSQVSPIDGPAMNGYRSFAVFPDGSKEGWQLSDEHDDRRAALVAHLEGVDGIGIAWCQVRYGDDSDDNRMEHCGPGPLAGVLPPWHVRDDAGRVWRLVSTCKVCGGSGRVQSWECVRCSGAGESVGDVALYRLMATDGTGAG